MLRLNVIQPSTSPWSSPVHLVKKKTGKWRFTIDYRLVNKRTKPVFFPLPNLHNFTANIDGCIVFSALDLKNAFWQLPVRVSDRKFTGFCTPRGNFEFLSMPFGLTFANSSFQHFINNVLRNLFNCCFQYIDDILVFTKTPQEHKRHLLEITHRLNTYGLTLNMEKSIIGVNNIDFLGYNLSSKGIAPLQDKISAVLDFPKPSRVKALGRFLGMVNFQRKFIPNASEIMQPLNDFLKKSKKNDSVIA